MNNKTISTYDAIQWMLKVALSNGEVTENAMKVLVDFASEYNISLAELHKGFAPVSEASSGPELPVINEEAVFIPKRIVRPMSDLKKVQEEEAKPKLSIRMPDGRRICREKATDTFRDFIVGMGWEDVHYLNFDVYGEDLITQDHPNGWYKEVAPGWYVNTNMKVRKMKTTAYEIARALGKNIVVSWD